MHPQSHPLFSTILTIYTLILLYLPSLFFTILLSPVLNSTVILLLSLLRLGANEQDSPSQDFAILDSTPNLESTDLDHNMTLHTSLEYGLHMEYNQKHDMGLESSSTESSQAIQGGGTKEGMNPKQVDTTTMAFLEWNMRAPLEIIYEAYEGEEDDDDEEEEGDNNEKNQSFGDKQVVGCERYPSLSMYYPDSETNSSSDDEFPTNEKWETYDSVFFKWEEEEEEEEEEREELIEISLDRYGKKSIKFCHSEEDNLIEINILN